MDAVSGGGGGRGGLLGVLEEENGIGFRFVLKCVLGISFPIKPLP